MLFSSSKCPLPALVMWCRTMRLSVSAGLDIVKVFRQQAKSGPRALRPVAKDIAEKLAGGDSLEDAFGPYRDRFPPLFVELVIVGEQTGRLEDTFHELEAYYETTMRVQRDFRSQMAYPAIQFVAAILVVSLLIFILGILGKKSDVLGLGLSGTSGAITFMAISFGFVGGILLFFKLSADSVRWRSRMEGMLMWLPVWGPPLLNFALQRFCLGLRMTSEAGLRAEKVLHYSFRATANSSFLAREEAAIAVVKRGGEIADALGDCGAPFPEDFRNSIMVAEETGQMAEVCERLSENYRAEAVRLLKQATTLTGWMIYALVAAMIIFFIFSIASTYIGAVNDATKGL